jgi:hypothetical protein
VKGHIVSVDHVASGHGRSGGVHVTLATDTDTVAVHLGPAWYIDAQTPRLEKDDHVEVEGSRVAIDGKPAIIARQVRKNGQTLTLRNADGVPAWAGHGRRGRPQN